MAEVTLFDNDAVLKLSAYQCWEAVSCTPLHPPAILAVARWSIAKQIDKARRVARTEAFRRAARDFIASCTIIEPSNEEVELAASIEERAIDQGGELDSGESLLVAVLIVRNYPRIVTGDKRAIMALAALVIEGLSGRIYCLEQVIQLVIDASDWQRVRASICSERQIDTALAMAFGCYSEPSLDDVLDGLRSYIQDLRSVTSDLLA